MAKSFQTTRGPDGSIEMEINAAGNNVAFWSTDQTENVEATREHLATDAPHAIDIWDVIEQVARAERGFRQQLRDEAGTMIRGEPTGLYARIVDLNAKISFFDNHDYRANATAEQLADRAKWAKSLRQLKARREDLLKKANSAPGYAEALIGRIYAWGARNAKTRFQPVLIEVPDAPEKAGKLLKTNLAARADFLQQRRETENAPFTVDEARASFHAYMDRAAAKGAPRIGGLFRNEVDELGKPRPGKISWADVIKPGTTDTLIPDPWLTLLWVCRDQIIEAVDKQIAAMGEKTKHRAVPLRDRPAMLKDFNSKLLTLEYEESALIRVLEDAGAKPARRHDMTVEAVLQIEAAKAKPEEDFG